MHGFRRLDTIRSGVAARIACVLLVAATLASAAPPPPQGDTSRRSREGGSALDRTAPDLAADAPAEKARVLTALLEARRDQALRRVREAAREHRASRIATLRVVLGVFSLSGVLLLFTPLVLRRRYRASRRQLWKYSLASALLFTATVQLFTLVLIGLWWIRGSRLSLSPNEVATSAAFDALKKWTERLPELGSPELEEAITNLVEGRYDSVSSTLLGNLQAVREDLAALDSISGVIDVALSASEYVPQLASIAACALLLLAIRPLLVEIVQLAPRAVEGGGSARNLVKRIALTLRGEFLASLVLIGVLLFLYVVPSLLFRFSIDSAIRSIVDSAVTGFGLLATEREASLLSLHAAILGWLTYFVSAIAIAAASIVLYISKSQKLLRARFHPSRQHSASTGFWIRGTSKLLWVFFVIAAYPSLAGILAFVLDSVTAEAGERIDWSRSLASGAIRAWLFLPMFWLAGGVKALRGLARYSTRSNMARSGEPLEIRM